MGTDTDTVMRRGTVIGKGSGTGSVMRIGTAMGMGTVIGNGTGKGSVIRKGTAMETCTSTDGLGYEDEYY